MSAFRFSTPLPDYGTLQNAERADLRGGSDNLRIADARPYLRISDHCRIRVRVADCCIQTAGESDKMRISHVIKTDQWRCVPHIRPFRIFSRDPLTTASITR